MKAVVYHGAGKPLALETLPDPEPGPDDVIVRVHRCGICGTDLHMTQGHQWDFPSGTVPGHEYAGEIVEVGSNVANFRKGDLITALPSTGCGHCEACYRGNLALCHNAPGVMGGYAELMRIPTSVAIKLPSTLSLADGALIEPLAVGLHGTRLSQHPAGRPCTGAGCRLGGAVRHLLGPASGRGPDCGPVALAASRGNGGGHGGRRLCPVWRQRNR